MPEESNEVTNAIAERLLFFFSDANVRSDNFMKQKLLKSETGFVPIDVLLRFNSVKCHTTEPKVIADVVKTLSDILVLSDDATAVGRVVPFTISKMNDNVPLSLYVANLPITKAAEDDAGCMPKYAVTVSEMRALFESYGKITLVKLRFKPKDGKDAPRKKGSIWIPSGSAFVEFETQDQAQAAADDLCTIKEGDVVEPKKSLEAAGNKLTVRLMTEWVDSKKAKHGEKAKEIPKKDDGEQPKKRDRDEVKEETPKEEFNVDWKPGCVISIKGLSESCDRESLRGMVATHMGITDDEVITKGVYADFSRGQTKGAIRFSEPCDTVGEIAVKLANGEIEIAGAKVESATVLDGEEETKYWSEFIDFKRKQIMHKRDDNRGGFRKKKFRKNY